jgi:hypothetical protein
MMPMFLQRSNGTNRAKASTYSLCFIARAPTTAPVLVSGGWLL